MVISYESMKLDGCIRRHPTHEKKKTLCHSTLPEDVAKPFGVIQNKGVNAQCVLEVL